jgi:hypothetical protein
MPITPPILSSGSREPDKRPQPIPRKVRDAIALMVCGRRDDPDCAPLSFIDAAKECGIRPDVMRKYLDRPSVRALLRADRRAFRDAICAGNELALQRIRDRGGNAMAAVAAVRALEQIDSEENIRAPAAAQWGSHQDYNAIAGTTVADGRRDARTGGAARMTIVVRP